MFQRANDWSVIHAGRARLTPADLATRDALMAELFRERGGRASLDVVSQLRVEDYATAQIQLGKVTRRLEALGAVSPAGNERKSLVSTYTTFSARVERLSAELPPPLASSRTPSPATDLEHLSEDALVDKLTELLRKALELRDEPQAREARIAADISPPAASFDGSPIIEPAAPEALPPAPEPLCAFCHQPSARCTAMKEGKPDVWRVLHYDHPDEVERRRQEATAVMFHQGGKPLPNWYTR